MSDTPNAESPCEHRFTRFRRWPVKQRYRCVQCGLITRHYDIVDGMALRPIHRHMSVAMSGFNTVPNEELDR